MRNLAAVALSVILVLIGLTLIGIMVLSQTEDRYTELYFSQNQTNNSAFVFTIHNQEGKTKEYSCKVYADFLAVDHQNITLEHNESYEFFYQLQGNVSQVKVELEDKKQSIYYWTNLTEENNGDFA